MAYISNKDYYTEVAAGRVAGASIVHKFGTNSAVGTTFVPVTIGGVYQTPQPASATTLRVKAGGNANDTAAGTGAREVTLQGLDASGNEQTVTVATNGASASTATTETFIRLYRVWVSASGTYATATTGSHSGDIVIENGAGGTDWATIASTGFAGSQSEIGAYTVPTGKKGYLISSFGFADGTKDTELIFFKREGVTDAAAPYEAMRTVFEEELTSGGEFVTSITAPIGPFTGPCDVGFLAKIDTDTTHVDIDFELLILDV